MDTVFIIDKNESIKQMIESHTSGIKCILKSVCDEECKHALTIINADACDAECVEVLPQKFYLLLESADTSRLCGAFLLANAVFCSKENLLAHFNEKSLVWNNDFFNDIRNRAELYLRFVGIDTKLNGFDYLSFFTAYTTLAGMCSCKYRLLPVMSEYFKKSTASIERAMRYAVEAAWADGDIEAQQAIFGYSISPDRGKPVLCELACMISEKIKDEMKNGRA